jgi:hypothetical protein
MCERIVRQYGADIAKGNVVDEMLRCTEYLLARKMLAKMHGGVDAKKDK